MLIIYYTHAVYKIMHSILYVHLDIHYLDYTLNTVTNAYKYNLYVYI